MAKKKNRHEDERRADDARRRDESAHRDDRESGTPGGGQGRRDAVGRSGVYPESASERPGADAPVRTQNAWGQGERGAAGYEDSGTSELASSEEIRRRIERDRQRASQRSSEGQRSSESEEDQRSGGDQRSGSDQRSR
ncbi:MAG TPA: hypothetical protein VFK04_10515 [Gemmatimonadaceae bacterium]|nr:hypothetical protein [Gemmatimonadaceae bacterium]